MILIIKTINVDHNACLLFYTIYISCDIPNIIYCVIITY